jgi:protein-S-isoprenylcysteine O-methyltransferase Ste14
VSTTTLNAVYLLGLTVAMGVRTYYGLAYRRNTTAEERRESMQGESVVMRFLMALWGVALLLPFVYMFTSWISFADYRLPGWLGAIGIAIFALAQWVLWRSHADLGTNWSPVPDPVAQPTLITNGVFKHVRHPMYAAHVLWGIAQPLLIQNWIAGPLALVSILGMLRRIPDEEAKLLQEFGAQYSAYVQRTGRIVPKLTRRPRDQTPHVT